MPIILNKLIGIIINTRNTIGVQEEIDIEAEVNPIEGDRSRDGRNRDNRRDRR